MQQVIVNLVVNARDAMPQGGRMSITTRNVHVGAADTETDGLPDGAFVRLAVSDSGTGMDEVTRTRLFEPFYTTKPKGQGTGLGLSMVHGIVTSANGQILVDSRPGTGSRFEIYLPSSKRSAMSQVVATGEEKRINGAETVLIVEDEEQIRVFLEKGLTALGYRVLVAADADAGLDICSDRDDIDVIVSDVIMPQTNGAEFLEKALRLQPQAAGIFMSGYTEDVVLQSGVDGSEIPLINKPFEIDQLAALIRRRLEGDAGLSP